MPTSRLLRALRSLAANTRRLRLAAHLTQEQLSERADIDVNTLRRVETAQTNPSLAMLLKIADALTIEVTDLLRPASMVRPRRGRPRKI